MVYRDTQEIRKKGRRLLELLLDTELIGVTALLLTAVGRARWQAGIAPVAQGGSQGGGSTRDVSARHKGNATQSKEQLAMVNECARVRESAKRHENNKTLLPNPSRIVSSCSMVERRTWDVAEL